MYTLTPEGKEYLKNNLPEINLVNLLSKSGRSMHIEDAKKKIYNFNIALQWAKKNSWIKIENGMLVLIKKPKQILEQHALEKIAENKKIETKILDILIQRKLVEKKRSRETEKLVGKTIDNLTPELIKTGLWKKVKLKPYNVEVVGKKIYHGKRQPYNQFLSIVRQKLVELGFKEMTGPIIETEFWNFDALYQAQNHPSRDWTQTYSLKYPKYGDLPNPKIVQQVKASHENGWITGSTGWGYKWNPKKASQLMPRAHDTACSARQLAKGVEIPGKYFAIKRCYRPDVIDTMHGIEFNQVEGIVIDKNLTFRDLFGLLKMFALEFAGTKDIKFYTDYYPFTEPSVQLSARHPEMGWIELAGAGIFREELTKPLGIEEPVIAWGLGIDRLAMCKLGINDIRELFSKNLDWLRKTTQFK
jgi:phenylalanyl-tRNA synthetase alpha chain